TSTAKHAASPTLRRCAAASNPNPHESPATTPNSYKPNRTETSQFRSNQRMAKNSTRILGAAIFGAGWVAGEHAKAYQNCPRTRLVAVGSRKEESARNCAIAAGAPDAFITTRFDELLKRPDVDLISITTPPGLHPELTIKAARAGKHVCIEKPIALDWKSCLTMQKEVNKAGVKSIVCFVLHWNPSLMNTRHLIDKGAIGQPYYIEVDYWHGMK